MQGCRSKLITKLGNLGGGFGSLNDGLENVLADNVGKYSAGGNFFARRGEQDTIVKQVIVNKI